MKKNIKIQTFRMNRDHNYSIIVPKNSILLSEKHLKSPHESPALLILKFLNDLCLRLLFLLIGKYETLRYPCILSTSFWESIFIHSFASFDASIVHDLGWTPHSSEFDCSEYPDRRSFLLRKSNWIHPSS